MRPAKTKMLAALFVLALPSCAGSGVLERRISSAPAYEAVFREFSPPAPVPEIMELKAGGEVPAVVYGKYPAKQIALTIVYKKYVEDEKQQSEATTRPAYDFFGGSEIQLAFSETIIDSVAAKGFLNTYQVHHDCEFYARGRMDSEKKFLGYSLESACPPERSADVRPKSAYFSLQAGSPDDHPLNSSWEYAHKEGFHVGYGNVLAVLNDDVKNRTTFTMGDSSSAGRREAVRTLRYRSEKMPDLLIFNDYLEAQVWGPLSIGDVSHFIVNCDDRDVRDLWGRPFGRITEEGLRKLKQLNLPVFQCVTESSSSGRPVRVREGQRL